MKIMLKMQRCSTAKLNPRHVCFVLAWVGLLLIALFLRAHDLAGRPVHADEATGARILAQQLEGHAYPYNPRHFHGPTLSLLAYPLAVLRGERDWASLTITTLRGSTVIGGMLLVLTPLLWWRTLGHRAALAAGAFLATSPLLVYYSRVSIHETWLTLFGMLSCAGIYHLLRRPSRGMAVATGFALGCMFATKITVAISMLSWTIAAAGLFLFWKRSIGRNEPAFLKDWPSYGSALIYLSLAALLSSFLIYSHGLQQPGVFAEALKSFFVYEPTAGHAKPAHDYAWRLLWPKSFGGIWWTEIGIFLCALGAVSLARWDCRRRPIVIFLGLATLAHFLIYSSIGYKTPWLMLLPWAHGCLLAGCLLMRPMGTGPLLRAIPLLLVLVVLAHNLRQSLAVTGRFENHERNPYIYVPTSRNLETLPDWLASLHTLQPIDRVAIVGTDYWPLPWYLRKLPTELHYWPEAAAVDLRNYPLVFSMPSERAASRAQLQSTHVERFRSLRLNVPLILFVRNDLENLWIQSDDATGRP